MNRLVGADVSAASFRRTFTAGAIAVTSDRAGVPKDYLGLPLREADDCWAKPAEKQANITRETVKASRNIKKIPRKIGEKAH